MAGTEFLAETLSGFDAQQRRRLINFESNGVQLQAAHTQYLRQLVEQLRGRIVTDVFFIGYAYNDHTIGTARAAAAAAEFSRIATWLGHTVSISSVDSAPVRASKPHSDEYWRGVDVLAYVQAESPKPPPQPLPSDSAPAMPGPKRYVDWEVYAAWGCAFMPLPGAIVSFNAYHFRRKAPNTAYGVWLGSVQFGIGYSIDAGQAMKLAKLIKLAGLTRVVSLLKQVPAGAAKSIATALGQFAQTAVGSISDPSYTDALAVTPFAASDLNGATAFGSSLGAGAGRSFSSAGLTVTQKMPQYKLKYDQQFNRSRWLKVSNATVDLVRGVDIGGWASGLPAPPSASANFVGGPMIALE